MAEEAPGREPTPWLSFGLLEFVQSTQDSELILNILLAPLEYCNIM